MFERDARIKPLLFKMNMEAQLWFTKPYLIKPQDFWNNVLWTDEVKGELGLKQKSHRERSGSGLAISRISRYILFFLELYI